MRYGTITGVEKPISRIVQGCRMLLEAEPERWFALLDAVFAQGINAFDHAHCYGGGQSERLFGKWLQARGHHEEVFLISKGCHPHDDGPRVTPTGMRDDIADSLKRLGVERIDLWLFHRDDPTVPVGPLAECAAAEIAAGRIGTWGASNWTIPRIAQMQAYCREHALVPMVASSTNFSLAVPHAMPWADCETISGPAHIADRDWYREQGFALFAWSSLAGGFLSGRIRRDTFEQVRGDFEERVINCFLDEGNWQRLQRLEELATDKEWSVSQLALAWVLHQDLDTYALAGAQTAEEAAANAAVADIFLTPEEGAWLTGNDA